ncbi:hypothetical protein FBU59_004428, partial [Linderina macrospora]
ATTPEAALDNSNNAPVHTVAAVSDNDIDMAPRPAGNMGKPQPLVVPGVDCEEEISAAMDVDILIDHNDMVQTDDTPEAAAEAERSWFDQCIDSMLTDEEPEPPGQFPHLLSPEDYEYDDEFEDEDEEFDSFTYGPGGQRTGVSGYGTIYSQPGAPMLKHSRSSTSIQSLCMMERDGNIGAHDAAEKDTAGANQPRYQQGIGRMDISAARGDARSDSWQESSAPGHVGGRGWDNYTNFFSVGSMALEKRSPVY